MRAWKEKGRRTVLNPSRDMRQAMVAKLSVSAVGPCSGGTTTGLITACIHHRCSHQAHQHHRTIPSWEIGPEHARPGAGSACCSIIACSGLLRRHPSTKADTVMDTAFTTCCQHALQGAEYHNVTGNKSTHLVQAVHHGVGGLKAKPIDALDGEGVAIRASELRMPGILLSTDLRDALPSQVLRVCHLLMCTVWLLTVCTH